MSNGRRQRAACVGGTVLERKSAHRVQQRLLVAVGVLDDAPQEERLGELILGPDARNRGRRIAASAALADERLVVDPDLGLQGSEGIEVQAHAAGVLLRGFDGHVKRAIEQRRLPPAEADVAAHLAPGAGHQEEAGSVQALEMRLAHGERGQHVGWLAREEPAVVACGEEEVGARACQEQRDVVAERGRAREPDFALFGLAAVPEGVVVPERAHGERRSPALDQIARTPDAVERDIPLHLRQPDAPDEAAGGFERGLEVLELAVEREGASGAREAGGRQRAPFRAAFAQAPDTARPNELQGVAASHHQARIGAHDAVEDIGGTGTVGVGQPEGRAGAQVAAQTHQIHHGVVGGAARLDLVDGSHVPDVEAPHLPGDLRARDRIHDRTGVDELLGQLEDVHSLEEERTLLGEEEGEALVDRDLARVGLHLAEVRVVGPVEGQVGGKPVGRVEAEVAGGIVVPEGVRVGVVCAQALPGDDRVHLEEQAGVEILEVVQRSRLFELVGEVAGERRPRLLVAGALHPAHDVDAPGLRGDVLEADALERDAHLDGVPLVVQAAVRLPDEVRVVVHRWRPESAAPASATTTTAATAASSTAAATALPPLDPDAVLLHAVGVDHEVVGAPPVVEGVEHDADVVVGPAPAVTLAEGGANPAGIAVPGANPEVDGVVAYQYQRFGRLHRRDALDRIILAEVAQKGRALPGSVIEPAVNVDVRVFKPRRGDLELPCRAIVFGDRGWAGRHVALRRHENGLYGEQLENHSR